MSNSTCGVINAGYISQRNTRNKGAACDTSTSKKDIPFLYRGRTRNQIEKLEAENANLKQKLINRKNADAQLKQLKNILDLAGTAGYKIVNAKVISHGSSQSFAQTITIDSGSNAGIKKNMTVLSEYEIAYPASNIIKVH